MRKLVFIFLTSLTITAMAQTQKAIPSGQTSLFERLGGTEGITLIVDDVIDAHMNNPAIKARFTPYLAQPEKLANIRQHTIDFFSAGSGGDIAYTGRDMVSTHTGMKITADEYMHVVDDILKVLDKHNIDQTSKNEVLMITWSLKGMIMGQ